MNKNQQLLNNLVLTAFRLNPMEELAKKLKESGWEHDDLEYELQMCAGLNDFIRQKMMAEFVFAY